MFLLTCESVTPLTGYLIWFLCVIKTWYDICNKCVVLHWELLSLFCAISGWWVVQMPIGDIIFFLMFQLICYIIPFDYIVSEYESDCFMWNSCASTLVQLSNNYLRKNNSGQLADKESIHAMQWYRSILLNMLFITWRSFRDALNSNKQNHKIMVKSRACLAGRS
jgi:hypothetical protein